ncbi:hypothetical protein G4B88_017149, partial [Cannabis sativa]
TNPSRPIISFSHLLLYVRYLGGGAAESKTQWCSCSAGDEAAQWSICGAFPARQRRLTEFERLDSILSLWFFKGFPFSCSSQRWELSKYEKFPKD